MPFLNQTSRDAHGISSFLHLLRLLIGKKRHSLLHRLSDASALTDSVSRRSTNAAALWRPGDFLYERTRQYCHIYGNRTWQRLGHLQTYTQIVRRTCFISVSLLLLLCSLIPRISLSQPALSLSLSSTKRVCRAGRDVLRSSLARVATNSNSVSEKGGEIRLIHKEVSRTGGASIPLAVALYITVCCC